MITYITDIKYKMKVFISSNARDVDYKLIRSHLQDKLDHTGIFESFVYESAPASSIENQDYYLKYLEQSDVILFLIDNKQEMVPEGVMKEYQHALNLDKIALYLFLNTSDREPTTIQDEVRAAGKQKYGFVHDIKDFVSEGYKSIIQDMLDIYRFYCAKDLVFENKHYSTTDEDVLTNLDSTDNNFRLLVTKDKFNRFTNTSNYIMKMNRFYHKDNQPISEEVIEYPVDLLFMEFSKY